MSDESKKLAELYPDVIDCGGLPQALQGKLEKLGSRLRVSRIDEGRTTLGFARVASDHRSSQIFLALEHRAFSIALWHRGICHGKGWATCFQEVVVVIQAFVENNSDIDTLVGEFDWLRHRLPLEGHQATSLVESAWQRYLAHPCEHRPMKQLRALVHAAATEPKLRQLFPYTSLDRLCFSRTTGYPYTRDCPLAFPISDGHYRVAFQEGDEYRVLGEGDASTAVDLLRAALPSDIGPAIDGTADD